MGMSALQAEILDIVYDHNGIKSIELIPLLNKEMVTNSEAEDFENAIDYLIDAGKVVEVEFIYPASNYRIHSFLLPAGSRVRVNNGQKLED